MRYIPDRELIDMLHDPSCAHLHSTAACLLDMRRERRRIRRRHRVENAATIAVLALFVYHFFH